jgi:hypothetical protein
VNWVKQKRLDDKPYYLVYNPNERTYNKKPMAVNNLQNLFLAKASR